MNSDSPPPDPPPFDPAALMLDWMTLWQSEAAGMSLDREVHENWARLAEIWTEASLQAATAQGTAQGAAKRDDQAGSARADDAPRPEAAADAPDAQREIAALRAEITELRQRLDRLEADRRRKQRSPRRP